MSCSDSQPNVVFVFADQWRGQATGYAGDPNVQTPHLDRLAEESVNFTQAVAGCPVCCPYRASLITGQYPLTHGVFLNDVRLSAPAVSIAETFKSGGYQTAYIGKWHLDGPDRSSFIPPQRRAGFEFWKVMECTHDYNNSCYYADQNVKLKWDGYDAIAQTREAQRYIRDYDAGKPFFMMLSWGPPHAPYDTAPREYQALYDPARLILRDNVPAECEATARKDLAGYYAHISALDACVGELLATLKECRLQENTIFIFTSDHGDMLGSQGHQKKQRPWEESIRVPFLLRWPAGLGSQGRRTDVLIDAPDIMPTLLGLCGLETPATVEGIDYRVVLKGGADPGDGAALLICPAPFGQWTRAEHGGKEYRGIRTKRYTYVRDLAGPWLLYDNEKDPYQLDNLCGQSAYSSLQGELETILQNKLKERQDEFAPAEEYIKKWNYIVDETGTVPYYGDSTVY